MADTIEAMKRKKNICCSCGVDTITEQVDGPMITFNKHKDWCLFLASYRLFESFQTKPWKVVTEELREICEKYAARREAGHA